ncbi:long-chain fatty acid transport protein 2-like [Genypterus blacodes]|uniref:long-chain fatty acid transport protein 2-like n=1 Tax=Genypterus blacodes TaxID=154954 RepID=UPI003F76DB76
MLLVGLVCAALLLLGLYIRWPYFLQDVQHFIRTLKVGYRLSKYRETNYTILDRFLERVKTHPRKPFIRFEDETLSYQDVDKVSNRAARVFLQNGIKEGETVALFLGNQPAFIWLWLGLVKIGCPAAFLNFNIRSKSLLHCIQCSGAKTLVAAEELQDAVDDIMPSLLEQQVTVFILTESCERANMKSLKDKVSQASSEPLPKDVRAHLTLMSPAVYIYTSGTTGLPKAAVISHLKVWSICVLMCVTGVNSKDVLYTCLPLYHITAFIGCTAAIERGITIALSRKFSASQFWDDCRKYDVTVVQYIGELMRYLCNTPKKDNDRSHKVRLAVGGGIRSDVWRDFSNRFGNVKIVEVYGATEGNFGLYNYTGKLGAIGRDTFFQRMLISYALIKFDAITGEPVRDPSGFCIKAKGEPGLLVSEITQKMPFAGYARDLQQTEKKRLHNVFKRGDMYFNTGDMMIIDRDNFIYFHDRTGDTFRWKGENVATTEVSDVLTATECIQEANVYGVNVPGQEGRAGMAAITLREGQKFDSRSVCQHVQNLLPAYARPRFIRIKNILETTGTFKNLKGKLVEEGFNPNNITEPLYFLHEGEKNYILLTQEIYNSVLTGKLRI